MPAIITHHLFGEEASLLLPAQLLSTEGEKLAFLLGNQGPDPFFFRIRALPPTVASCHELGNRMHEGQVFEAFSSLREGVGHLRAADTCVGRAFVLGLLAHYLLDSTAHPFVYAQENAICGAGVGLEDAHGQVHALIESDIDVWMLRELRGRAVAEATAAGMLARTRQIGQVASALLSQTALEVFGIELSASEYARCVDDCEFVYAAIEPAGSPRSRALTALERAGRRFSLLDALAHAPARDDGCPAANLARRPWADPATGEVSTRSFPDLFQEALDAWGGLSEAYVRSDADALGARLRQRNYNGELIG